MKDLDETKADPRCAELAEILAAARRDARQVLSLRPRIEVAECRFPKNSLPPLYAIIADGCASGRYVYGDPIHGWRDGLSEMGVDLEIDGKPVRRGAGSDVMCNPLAPLVWLAEELRRWGEGLRVGEDDRYAAGPCRTACVRTVWTASVR